jgi:hypothetical protein
VDGSSRDSEEQAVCRGLVEPWPDVSGCQWKLMQHQTLTLQFDSIVIGLSTHCCLGMPSNASARPVGLRSAASSLAHGEDSIHGPLRRAASHESNHKFHKKLVMEIDSSHEHMMQGTTTTT